MHKCGRVGNLGDYSMKQSVFVGIDVAQEKLDVYLKPNDTWHLFANTPAGWEALAQLVKPLKPDRIVLEASGGYEKGVAKALLAQQLPVVRVNPERARKFAGALGELAKNDRIDARMLATFASCLDTRLLVLPSEDLQVLQSLKRQRDFLLQQVVDTKNLLRTTDDDVMKPLMQQHLAALTQRVKAADTLIRQTLKQRPALNDQVKLLCTAKGVGVTSAVALLTEMPELGSLSHKSIAALAGVAPYVRESGKYKGQSRLSGGRARARKALYMPTLVAVRHNPVLKAFYERLKGAGKPKKKALAACMRKFLCQLNAMMRDQQPWQIPV